jgi:hypothetical protein
MTISGGKITGTPASWPFLQTGQTLIKETLSPLGDNLPRQIQTFPDLFVPKALGGKEDNFGTHDISVR